MRQMWQGVGVVNAIIQASGRVDVCLEELQSINVATLTNWSLQPPSYKDIESVPAIWGEAALKIGYHRPGGNSPCLMGFHGVDSPKLADMTPEKAAYYWEFVETYYKRDFCLISPSWISDDTWLPQMVDCFKRKHGRPPKFHALGWQLYPREGETLIEQAGRRLALMLDWCEEWGVSGGTWVTSWNCETPEEMQKTWIWMHETPAIVRQYWHLLRHRPIEGVPYTGLFNPDKNSVATTFGDVYKKELYDNNTDASYRRKHRKKH